MSEIYLDHQILHNPINIILSLLDIIYYILVYIQVNIKPNTYENV